MICQDFLPCPALRSFVKSYHLRHFVFSPSPILPSKPYAPRPEQTLAFYPRGHERVEYPATHQILERPPSVIIGQAVERTNRQLLGPEFMVFLVNFQPGALYRLTGLPMDEVTNSFIDAEAIFSTPLRAVNERLNSTDSYPEMITILETFLLDMVKNVKRDPHSIDTITHQVIQQPHLNSVLQLAESSCFSPRQFERHFKQRTGISPKLFTRIARLNKALRMKYNQPTLDWLSIALYGGYHDYQHLAKDFLELAGSLPTTYLGEESNAPERHFGFRDSSL